MSKNKRNHQNNRPRGRERRLRVRSQLKNPPDLKKLGGALVSLAMAQARAEKEAREEHEARQRAERHHGDDGSAA